ncbi:MAG: type II secretion system protein [Oscillospiraceae bacterium]|jgi:hypothetical protein
MRGRNRETLVLLELAIVLLVFAVFAAGCLRIFAAAREIARESNDLHRAAEWAQSAAECFKALGGDPKETASFLRLEDDGKGNYTAWRNSDWQTSGAEGGAYILKVEPGDGRAQISVARDGEILICLEAWVALYGD